MTMRVVLLLVALLGSACERKSAVRLAPVRPFLWSITKDGKTSHLLGTMHTGVDPGQLPTYVWDTLDAARTVAVETDLADAAKMPVLRTDGTSLRDELGPAYWVKLEEALGAGEAARLATFKPMIPATLVSMHGLPKTESLDGAIEARAHAKGKPVVFLEPLEREFAVLDKWMDLRALKDMLDDVADIDRTGAQMVAAFSAGDETQLLAVTARERGQWLAKGRSAAEYDEQMEDLLYRRNASWLPALERLLADGGGFVAVGAAHTVGPRSLVELMAQRGYKVTRITR